MKKQELKNGWFIFEKHFFNEETSSELFSYFFHQLNWQSGEIKLFGRVHAIPRKQVYYSDDERRYSYSGKTLAIDFWDDRVGAFKLELSKLLNTGFNACLANLYRNGQDSNGWHADDEKELGQNPIIASLSFGATRRFDLKHKLTNERISFELNSGSLLVMGGEMQHFWKHQIPKQKKIDEPRINLTFRKIIG